MKGAYKIKIESFEIKIEGMPIKCGDVEIECSGEYSWFDTLCITKIFKLIPKWVAKLSAELSKLEKI
jgi:hypothetical protein